MSARDFLDSNVFVYAYDTTDLRKQSIAQDLVKKALLGEMVASTQVIAEFATTLLHKVAPPANSQYVITLLDALSPIKLILPDEGIVRRAVEARGAYGVHFYDGMIIAAAERAGSATIWSEDLNSGQNYFGMQVQNPF